MTSYICTNPTNLGGRIISRCRAHLYCVVAIAQFSQREAAHIFKEVHALGQRIVVALGAQLEDLRLAV